MVSGESIFVCVCVCPCVCVRAHLYSYLLVLDHRSEDNLVKWGHFDQSTLCETHRAIEVITALFLQGLFEGQDLVLGVR